MSVIRQMSLLGADAAAPGPADLYGLFLAGGELERRDALVRLSIAVDHPWRASVLVAESARRGLAATSVSTARQHIEVRTAHSPVLADLAATWVAGRPGADLQLDGQAIRLWVEAAGRRDGDASYVLPLRVTVTAVRDAVAGALAMVGLSAQLVSRRGEGGASYRIVGKKRLARLVELVGDPPKQAPADIWPS